MHGAIAVVRKRLASVRWASVGRIAVILLGLLLIPGRMAWMNWHTHDRSRNWAAWETAYNMLQTCDRDGILITAGDNDTFPLWFLQDVEGIRRDVRVVNLSLANTNWYVQQLKDRPYYAEAKAVPLSLGDGVIAAAQPAAWETQVISLPVPPETYSAFGITDTALTNKGSIEWKMRNTVNYGSTPALRFQDVVVLDLVKTNQWKRPIYFSVTCPPDCRIGLDEYVRMCGLAFRLTPTKSSRLDLGVDEQALAAQLMNEPPRISRGPQRGFKQSTVSDTTVYLDDNELRPLFGVRLAYRSLASYYLMRQDLQKAVAVVDRLQRVLPPSRMLPTIEENVDFASLYLRAGDTARFAMHGTRAEQQFAGMSPEALSRNPSVYGAMLELYNMQRSHVKSLNLLQNLERVFPGDPGIKSRIEAVQQLMKREEVEHP